MAARLVGRQRGVFELSQRAARTRKRFIALSKSISGCFDIACFRRRQNIPWDSAA
jgi:hypothetical protein